MTLCDMVKANIEAELEALPLEFIISAPMTGAINAQAMAAQSTIDFIEKIGLKDTGGKTTVNMVDFVYAIQNNKSETKKLSVPLLSMVPVPFIRIKDINIAFDFKIETMQKDQQKESKKITVDSSYNIWFQKTSVHGVYSSSKNSKSTVDKSAHLAITVNAVQDEMPTGLKTMLDIFSDLIQAKPNNSSRPGAPEPITA